MSFIDLILLLIIAGLCGAIGQAITGFSRGGCLVSIAVGFIGALIGGWIAREMSLPEFFVVKAGTFAFPVVWSIIGSAIFVAVVSLISRRR
ncbi:MAG: GlsB/YeaQ/YmgE family stress response membrane protein [Cyclonatronaceae bacterium]